MNEPPVYSEVKDESNHVWARDFAGWFCEHEGEIIDWVWEDIKDDAIGELRRIK